MNAVADRLVTVVIPCFDQDRFVREAVDSALHQAPASTEVIVVDDGSCRPVEASLRGLPLRVIRQPNLGVAAARNAGFGAASGEFVIFLDADDRLLAGAAAAGLRELSRHPDAVFATGACQVVDESGSPAPFTQRRPLTAPPYVELLCGNFIWMPGQVIFRRAALGREPFDRSVNACADYDLYLRLARRFPVAVHDGLVADYRQHPANMSGNAGLMLRTSLRVLDRQRPLLRTGRERAAYREGLRFWRSFYGERLVEEIRTALHTRGHRARAARKIGTMLRYHPAGALRQLLRKARVMLRGGRTGAPAERVPW